MAVRKKNSLKLELDFLNCSQSSYTFIDCKGMKRAAVKGRFMKERLNIVTYATMMTVRNINQQKRKHSYPVFAIFNKYH